MDTAIQSARKLYTYSWPNSYHSYAALIRQHTLLQDCLFSISKLFYFLCHLAYHGKLLVEFNDKEMYALS